MSCEARLHNPVKRVQGSLAAAALFARRTPRFIDPVKGAA
jgi:hypothetical protein